MSVKSTLSDFFSERGIDVDPDELDQLAATVDEHDEVQIDLSDPLPGKATGMAEVFFSGPKSKPVEEGGLLWSPIAVDGQWALRPDGKGGKIRSPLRIVAGRSQNQRQRIGMADIVDAFQDDAVEQVTIPSTHNNLPTENNGYVRGLKIVKAKVGGKPVSVLMAGEDFTDPEAKKKVLNGSTRGRSMGLLYDYERTDTAKSYPVALEHVALTPKPWLRGMPQLSRPLKEADELATVSLSLSDDEPKTTTEPEAQGPADGIELDFLAEPAVSWSHEDSPKWLQEQVDQILRAKRAEKAKTKAPQNYMVEDSIVSYRCVEAKPGFALIADAYGDGANYWVASISVVNGEVEISKAADWKATKKIWTPDERPTPTGNAAPLSDGLTVTVNNLSEATPPSALEIARVMRFERGRIDSTNLAMTAAEKSKLKPSDFVVPGLRMFPIHDEAHAKNALARAKGTQYEADAKKAVKKRYPKMNIDMSEHPRGGGTMTDPTQTLQLSEEARALITKAEERAAAAEQKAISLAQTVDRLVGTVNSNEADAFIGFMKRSPEEGGLGLSEERGFSGMLREVHAVLLADDGAPALQSDHFADDKNASGELSLTQIFKRVFGALRTAEGSVIKLGEIVKAPSELKKDEDPTGKGKPPKDGEETDETNLSDDEHIAAAPSGLVAGLGIKSATANQGGDSR